MSDQIEGLPDAHAQQTVDTNPSAPPEPIDEIVYDEPNDLHNSIQLPIPKPEPESQAAVTLPAPTVHSKHRSDYKATDGKDELSWWGPWWHIFIFLVLFWIILLPLWIVFITIGSMDSFKSMTMFITGCIILIIWFLLPYCVINCYASRMYQYIIGSAKVSSKLRSKDKLYMTGGYTLIIWVLLLPVWITAIAIGGRQVNFYDKYPLQKNCVVNSVDTKDLSCISYSNKRKFIYKFSIVSIDSTCEILRNASITSKCRGFTNAEYSVGDSIRCYTDDRCSVLVNDKDKLSGGGFTRSLVDFYYAGFVILSIWALAPILTCCAIGCRCFCPKKKKRVKKMETRK